MAVDDRHKRASAMSLLSPFMPTTNTDTTSGVDDEERWAVTWMYNGIAIGAAAAIVSLGANSIHYNAMGIMSFRAGRIN